MKIKRKTKGIYRLRVGEDGPLQPFALLTELHHVSHLRRAMRILEDVRISAQRVDDDSILDFHRVAVTWLAPNRWGGKGSRYGTVQFTFEFADLLKGKKIYWVEGVEGRKLPTCRLLITNGNVAHLPVKLYDPLTTDGPLKRIDGSWYWRNDLEFEVLLQGDLPLARCHRIETVSHNADRCGRTCGEVGQNESYTAARVLAGLMAGRYSLPQESFVCAGLASFFLQMGWFGLAEALALDDADFDGTIKSKDAVDAVVRAALSQLASGEAQGAAETVLAVAGDRRVRSSLKRLLEGSTEVALGSPRNSVIGLAALTA